MKQQCDLLLARLPEVHAPNEQTQTYQQVEPEAAQSSETRYVETLPIANLALHLLHRMLKRANIEWQQRRC
jgi:hypothetical protein